MAKKLPWANLPTSIQKLQHEKFSYVKLENPVDQSQQKRLTPDQEMQRCIKQYLSGYSNQIQNKVYILLKQDKLAQYLDQRYPEKHHIIDDQTLYEYVQQLKRQYLRKAAPLSKICYDDKLQTLQHALGTHTYVSRVQGQKLKAKHEIRVASIFKQAPFNFLQMIIVHELAHCKEKQHNKAFYQLCVHMLPQYHQLELDTRIFLLLRAYIKVDDR